MSLQITYQDKATQTDIIEDDALEKILKTITTLSIKVDSMGNEIEKLKTNEVKLKSKGMNQITQQCAELCRLEDIKISELKGDVGILHKAQNVYQSTIADRGVDFQDVRFNCPMSEIINLPRAEYESSLFPANLRWSYLNKERLIAVQLNHFDCGGVAVSMCLSHKVVNGTTMGNLSKIGDVFASDHDSEIRQFSSVDAVSSLLYKTAASNNSQNPSVLTQMVDLRSITSSIIPQDYVGNASTFFYVSAANEEQIG
ncbi:hypothetical protein BC332_03996 [Capsicum chinense]|nr:hypothetical protein BC332_03996 [Capsicum chinense]